MSIPAPAALARHQVTWPIGWAGSTPGPLAGASGHIAFEASATVIAYSDATVLPEPVVTPVIGGVMVPVDLIENDVDVWNWKVTPRLGVAWEPFHINVDGPVNIASAATTPGKGPVRVVKGDPGAQGASLTSLEQIADDTLRGEIHDPLTGETTTRTYVLPRGPEGPYGGTAVTDPQVASYVQAATATRAALMTTLTETGTRPVGKGELVLNVRDFGAVGDGITDDSAALRDALAAAAGQELWLEAGKTYFCGDATYIQIPSGTTLDGRGATIRFDGPARSSVAHRLVMEGTIGPQIALTANTDIGTDTLALASTAGLSVGDTLLLASNTRNDYEKDDGPNYLAGEPVTIASISGDTVTLSEKVIYPYTTSAAAYARRLNPVENSHVRGVKFVDIGVSEAATGDEYGQRAVCMIATRGCTVERCTFQRSDASAVYVRNSVDFRVAGNSCWSTRTPNHNQKIYVIGVFGYARNGVIEGNTIYHGASGVGFSDAGPGNGNSVHCIVRGNSFIGCHRGVATHTNSNYLTIEDNTFDSCRVGINPRVRAVSILRNRFMNTSLAGTSGNAIILAQAAREIDVAGNVFENVWAALATNTAEYSDLFTYSHVTFTENTIRTCMQAAVSLDCPDNGIDVRGTTVTGNTFEDVRSSEVLLRGRHVRPVVARNRFGDAARGPRAGVQSYGSKFGTFTGNSFGEDATPYIMGHNGDTVSEGNLISDTVWLRDAGLPGVANGAVLGAGNTNPRFRERSAGGFLTVSTTQDWASIPAGVGASTVVVVPGARLGDAVIGIAQSTHVNGIIYNGAVINNSGSVSVRAENYTGSAIDMPLGTLTVVVRKSQS